MEERERRAAEAAEASDPAAAPERLLALLEHHPAAVLANPAFALLRVEQPDWCTRIPWAAAERASQHPDVPVELAYWMAKQTWRLVEFEPLVVNAALPTPLRRALFMRLRYSGATPQVRAVWSQFLTADELAALACPPERPLTDAEMALLLELGNIGKAKVVQHPSLSTATLERLFDAGQMDHFSLLMHPSCDLERLLRSLESDRPLERETAARHAKVPKDLPAARAASQDAADREAVALDPALPAACVVHLVYDPDERVRMKVAGRRDLAPEQAADLMADKEAKVRRAYRRAHPGEPVWKR